MSLKRKAIDEVRGHPSKRSTPAPSTPNSDDEDDEYLSGSNADRDEEDDDSDADHIRNARKHLDFSAVVQPGRHRQKDALFGEKDFSWLSMKPDHNNRPIWIDPSVSSGSKKGPKITLEAFSPLAAQGTDLLTMIAEPQSRPAYIHEWRLSEHSLYAALSVGYTGEYIIRGLEAFSKTPVPPDVIRFINNHTKHFGKVKLVLRNNKFWLESDDEEIISLLTRDVVIGSCIQAGTGVEKDRLQTKGAVIQGTAEAKGLKQANQGMPEAAREEQSNELRALQDRLLDEDDDEEEETLREVLRFQIAPNKRDEVAKRCLDIGYPATYEYDFENDHENVSLPIDLRPSTQIRPYQEKALSKMFGNSRAKSGIIVLPCGAGKTLVGITAACHVGKSVVVLTTNAMSSYQWANEFKKWSDIKEEDVAVFSKDDKKRFHGEAGVLVANYSMITAGGKRSHDAQIVLDWIQSREWGLMILDEVHVVPAKQFRKVGEIIRSHCKLGLTATLLREDDKIGDLNFLIGPKLYEANWMELANQGHIAKVQCAEVWCPMSMEFYLEYQKETTRKAALYYIMNPVKYQVCQFLIDYHEKRGDKIIVFSDNLFALQHYALEMKKPYICGATSERERISVLENFQHNELINTIFLSKIGDTSLDLPEATCLIQISAHYASRRQEAQRLGRILRAKRRNDEGFNAFFYSLVSKDTTEMVYSAKRQAFLVDQGYAFKTITHLAGIDQMPGLKYTNVRERLELLSHVQLQSESAAEIEKVEDNLWSDLSGQTRGRNQSAKKNGVRRQAISMADASGGGIMAPMYREQDRKSKKGGPESEYFQREKRRRENLAKKRRKAEEEGE